MGITAHRREDHAPQSPMVAAAPVRGTFDATPPGPPAHDDSLSQSAVPPDDAPPRRGPFGRFVAELHRRKVISTAGVYLVGSFVVMQVVDDVVPYMPLIGDPERAGRVILLLLTGGFPIAMALSWFFELTPPQLARELTRQESDLISRLGNGTRALRADTLAVLPFENLSDDVDDAYFAAGVSDDVTMALAQIAGLRVLPRSTVAHSGTSGRSVWEIAGELGAAALITGSVRRIGTRARVVVVAMDARSEDRLWSESFDRELDDIFRVQSEIATSVARAIARELTPEDQRRIEERGTRSGEAYDLYLRARFLWNQRTETSLSESLSYFQRALERDPDFALAHTGVADAHAVLGVYGMRPPLEALPAARAAAERALAIDPTLGEARATVACVKGLLEWAWETAEAGFLEAARLAPSYATAPQWYAMNVLTPLGRFAEARDQLAAAALLDPESAAVSASRGVVSFYAREFDAARSELSDIVRRRPEFALGHYFLGRTLEAEGDTEGSIAALEEAVSRAGGSSEMLAALGHALARSGRTDDARELLTRLQERRKSHYVSSVLTARILLGLERTDEALADLENALRERATELVWLGVDPVYDPLRGTPAFEAMLSAIGLASD